MLLIGITGGIACGKTEVAKVFRKKGAVILSGDQIGKEVVENKNNVLRELVKVFGTGILKKDGVLNRRKLGELAFRSRQTKEELNRIVHPHLLRELRGRIRSLKAEGKHEVVVVDAALIVEWGLEEELDYLIFVESKRKDKIKRLQKERGYSKGETLDRIKTQLPEADKKEKADFVIKNDKGLAELKKRAGEVWDLIVSSQIE
jgi:dephospho-CoA kinase